MNIWMGIGNLTKDPELAYTTGANQTAVCKFTIAVNEYGDEAQFINVKAFGKQAENCHKYLAKGRAVGVTGKLHTCYKDREGNTRFFTEIIAKDIQFLGGRDETPKQEVIDGFSRIADEEVPF